MKRRHLEWTNMKRRLATGVKWKIMPKNKCKRLTLHEHPPNKSPHALSACSLKTHWNMIPFPSVPRSSNSLVFLQKSRTHISSLHACRMPRPSTPPHVWWTAQMTKLYITYSSSFSRYLLNFRSTHLPQHPVLENTPANVVPFIWETKFHTHIDHKDYSQAKGRVS